MPTIDRQLLRDQIELYAEQSESWKPDHDEAMACRNLEDLIRLGRAVFRGVQNIDEDWSAMIRSGATPLLAKDAEEVADWYRRWYAPCAKVLGDIARFEGLGYTVEGADEFRDCCCQAELKNFDVQTVFSAVEQLNQGRARSLAEAMNELRSRSL